MGPVVTHVDTSAAHAPPAMRILRLVMIVCGLIGLLIFVTIPMDAIQQSILTLLGIVFFLIINRLFRSRRASLVLVVMSVAITARYLFWRVSTTLVFEDLFQSILAFGLFAAELYAGMLLTISYFQTAYPLERKPMPLPADPALWPTIDVFIPSYNETLDLVRPTVFAAMSMDWPREKMQVWILDDGRRPEFKAFAEQCGCGYIIRPDNKGAKAGNLNHALRHTSGEYIAIFDCDHAPTRSFLQMTLGWLVRDARIALVQTPHHFYSPDPFERNLARKRLVPNEGLLFYGLTQLGNDLWNASFFCGSCAVLRRTALTEIGGVPHETVTEDCHCALRMQQLGWHTAFLRVPLSAGLATERLALHIGQRIRWARGMLQIMRTEYTPVTAGLSLVQRICYFAGGFSFLFALPRLVFLTSPLAFLFFGQSVIAASPEAIIAYAGSHMFHSVATTSRLNGRNRHSFWAEIYEASMAVPLVPVTLLTLWDPSKGKFNVTDKGGTLEQGYLDTKAVMPNLILLMLLFTGFCIGLFGIATTSGLAFQAYLLNTIWAGMCLIPLSASIAVGRESEQSRHHARVDARVPCDLLLDEGGIIPAVSSDISMSGAKLTIDRPLGLADGDAVRVAFHSCGETIMLHATALRWEGEDAFLRFQINGIADQAAVSRLFFSRPDAWLHWDHWPKDRPLHALKDVVMATADVVFRRYRFGTVKHTTRADPTRQAIRVSSVISPRPASTGTRDHAATAARRVTLTSLVLVLVLFALPTAQAQGPNPAFAPLPPLVLPQEMPRPVLNAPIVVNQPPAAASPTASVPPAGPAPTPSLAPPVPAAPAATAALGPDAAPLPPGAREVRYTLRQLGQRGSLQMRGVSDLQGVLFGLKADEVVTAARLSVNGASSPALIPALSQVAITLNEQAIGTLAFDAARTNFGPVTFDLDPLFFGELNRLNFRFTGRYAVDCNDPLSGLLWATISDLSTVTLRIERLATRRDLSLLPEPLFDRRELRAPLTLPFVIPESASASTLQAAAIAASWFAVQADYRGASFPVARSVPPQGHAVMIVSGADATALIPRLDGPTLALLPNPADPFGTVLVIAGRTEAETAMAATGLAINRAGFSGTTAAVLQAMPAVRKPYDATNWLPANGPVKLGTLVDRAELQVAGYTPGPVRIPLRTAPDLITWRNAGLPLRLRFRGPPEPVIDAASSRLDVSISDRYLQSFPLSRGEGWWPWAWAMRQLAPYLGNDPGLQTARLGIPPYGLFGRDELQLHFDMRPFARGDCAAVPGDIHAAIDPDSTIDISPAWRFARMPNVGLFASAGFPFTRMADLSETAAVLPEHPNTVETEAFLDTIGHLAAIVGLPATGLAVTTPATLGTASHRDLLVFGAWGRQPAFASLLKGSALQVSGDRLVANTPDALQDIRALLIDNAPDAAERNRAVMALNEGDTGMGVVLGVESPLQSGRSVVAITGLTPAAMLNMATTLRDPEQTSKIQGDLSLLRAGQIAAFRTAPQYEVGHLPLWLRAQLFFGNRPERAGLLLLALASACGLSFYWMLRRRAIQRLRARSTKARETTET